MSLRLKIRQKWHWVPGLLALIWVLLRSGANPKRLSYPCQQAALPVAGTWVMAAIAFFAGSVLLRRFAKVSCVAIVVAGAVWFLVTLTEPTRSAIYPTMPLPVWEVADAVSSVFVMDYIPLTTGSLAAGDASVPDEYLSDPAIDRLVDILATEGVFLHRTATHPDGIVGSDNIVVIKGNFQWNSQNTTSTDRIKGLIWQVLEHPEGFSGEILVCDNTQDIGTGINDNDNNSEDPDQSILDVVSTFYAKGYPVYCLGWNNIWDVVASEYSSGDYDDGYVYESATGITYPKFRSPSEDYYISMRFGIWDSLSSSYDSSRLCIIDFPVLKAHGWAGATIAVKNWIGLLTTAYADVRYDGFNYMHEGWFFGTYALVARVMAVTYPRLSIVDAAWTTTYGPNNLNWIEKTNILVASTDPVAASWYAAKFALTPIARYPGETNPDQPNGPYNRCLNRWAAFLRDSTAFPTTNDSGEISVYEGGVGFHADTLIGWAPLEVDFDAYSLLDVDTWTWDFGDGDSALGQSPTHVYELGGTYDVKVEIDAGGDIRFRTKHRYVAVLADSMIALDTAGGQGDTVEVIVRARNTTPVNRIIIPVETFGTLNVTHDYGAFSTDGCRTDYFETQTYVHFDPGNKRYTVKLETSSSELQPGEGPILKLRFIIPESASDGQVDTVDVDGYSSYLPWFSGSILEYQVVPIAGAISLLGCCNHDGIRGDFNYDLALNVADLSGLVDYLFFEGSPPPCEVEGDADGSGATNVADLTYLVDYLFFDGPSPQTCP